MFARCLETTECRRCFSYLEHLLDFLPRQVDVELVEELEDLADAQTAVAVLVGLGEGLFQPRDDNGAVKESKRDEPRHERHLRRPARFNRSRPVKGYWSRVRWRLARLSSSLMPAIKYFKPVIQVRASSPVPDTRSRDAMCSP